MDYKQFDFGNKEAKLLLEVHGDYWHPLIYGEDKKPLSQMQIDKKEQDIEKQLFAQKHNIKLFVIWERDILTGNWEVLEEIKREFDKIQASRDNVDS